MSMVIIMPDEGTFADFENSLTSVLVDNIIGNMTSGQVNLTMPKFEFESDFSLNDALKAMGMTNAFSDSADFSGITNKVDLAISDVIHKAFVAVDEEGTEAAAATAVIITQTSMPTEIADVNLNHSFIFLSGISPPNYPFIGRVINPLSRWQLNAKEIKNEKNNFQCACRNPDIEYSFLRPTTGYGQELKSNKKHDTSPEVIIPIWNRWQTAQ
jgi:serine protease inhibitor